MPSSRLNAADMTQYMKKFNAELSDRDSFDTTPRIRTQRGNPEMGKNVRRNFLSILSISISILIPQIEYF
jgi:hypothetical protein